MPNFDCTSCLEAVSQISGLKLSVNPAHQSLSFPEHALSLNSDNMAKAQDTIIGWDGYAPTPLIDLSDVAQHIGCKRVLYKDESTRFGLGSFKALGGAYALFQVAENLANHQNGVAPQAMLTFASATDGNHGRSVAWGARQIGAQAKIYIHTHVSEARAQAMRDLGADIIRVDGNYEASLAACKADAQANGWHLISDTSWTGYRDVPLYVMAGYSLIGKEILQQDDQDRITHAFLPVGVGGLASGVVAPLWQAMGDKLGAMISVESNMSACFHDSIVEQQPVPIDIKHETLMAGLSCGEISTLAWEILQSTLSHAITINDDAVAPLMRWFHHRNTRIEAGECATSGLAALLQASYTPKHRDLLGLTSDSVVLLIGTEGATDPAYYEEVLAGA